MIKTISKTLFVLILVLVFIVIYLSVFGLKTKKFNKEITKNISKINKKIELNLNEVSYLLSPFDLNVQVTTKNPKIILAGNKLEVKKIKTDISLKSLLSDNLLIDNIKISTKEIKINDVILLVRSFRNSPQLFILDNIIKDGTILADIHLNFDKKNSKDVFFQTGSFDTAPLMARTLTVLAGPIANFILSFLILISFLLINGIPSNKVILSDVKDHPFIVDPLLPNDEIISINGYMTPTLDSFYALVKNEDLKETVKYTIKRNGLLKEMPGPNPFPALIENVTLRSSAFNAGLKSGDVIQEINSFEIAIFRYT